MLQAVTKERTNNLVLRRNWETVRENKAARMQRQEGDLMIKATYIKKFEKPVNVAPHAWMVPKRSLEVKWQMSHLKTPPHTNLSPLMNILKTATVCGALYSQGTWTSNIWLIYSTEIWGGITFYVYDSFFLGRIFMDVKIPWCWIVWNNNCQL